MIFFKRSCSSVTFAQPIILRMSCFISRTGDTNKQVAMFSCPSESILNQAQCCLHTMSTVSNGLSHTAQSDSIQEQRAKDYRNHFHLFALHVRANQNLKLAILSCRFSRPKMRLPLCSPLAHEHKDIIGLNHYPKELTGYYNQYLLCYHCELLCETILNSIKANLISILPCNSQNVNIVSKFTIQSIDTANLIS